MKWTQPAIVGLLLLGGIAGLTGCAQMPTVGTAGPVPTTTNAGSVTIPMTMDGAISVSFALPAGHRWITTTALQDMDHVDLSVDGDSTATASFTKFQIATGMANGNFEQVLPGDYTVTAIARDSGNAELTRASVPVTVVAGETQYVSLSLAFDE
ncbi:MAG TPA: hypothetical protein V6D05_00125 [Stenomitos sp.]